LDTEAVVRSRLFVDWKESALAEADDVRIPLQERAITESHILGDLSDLVSGLVVGRNFPEDKTLFKSVGLAVEDLAAARYVYGQAEKSRAGCSIELGAERRST